MATYAEHAGGGNSSTSSSFGVGDSGGQSTSRSGMQYLPWQNFGISNTLPQIQNSLTGINGQIGGGYSALRNQLGSAPGSQGIMTGDLGFGAPPSVTVGGVYSPELIRQNVNSIRGIGNASTEGQILSQSDKLAGAGYGARSPLATQMAVQARMGNQANTQGAVNQFTTTAAQQNAAHRLATEQAAGQFRQGEEQLGIAQQGQNLGAYQAIGNQDLGRIQVGATLYDRLLAQQNNLYAALGGYLHPNPFSASDSSNFSTNKSGSVAQSGNFGLG